ncbi:hypothetical protein [Eubacterium sp. 1001713B170207_170306_E7]|nr:hypothetical protein [Eubacterium sp. 1001713B170207_170306_E7]
MNGKKYFWNFGSEMAGCFQIVLKGVKPPFLKGRKAFRYFFDFQ